MARTTKQTKTPATPGFAIDIKDDTELGLAIRRRLPPDRGGRLSNGPSERCIRPLPSCGRRFPCPKQRPRKRVLDKSEIRLIFYTVSAEVAYFPRVAILKTA
jgi:hypothetical protein